MDKLKFKIAYFVKWHKVLFKKEITIKIVIPDFLWRKSVEYLDKYHENYAIKNLRKI